MTDVFNVANIDKDGFDTHRTMHDLLPADSSLFKRLEDVATEIARGRTDKEFHYLLKDDPQYATTRRIRQQFWNVFNQTISLNKNKLQMSAVYAGLMSAPTFHKLLECDIRATYILTQPHDIKTMQRDLLYEGYKHMDEIMAIPVMDAKGKPDYKAIQVKMNIIKMMEDRIAGSVVQREHKFVENKNTPAPAMDSQDNLDKLKAEVDRLKVSMGKKEIEEAKFKEV